MSADPHISLVFVNYQSVQYLKMALESLLSFERETDFFEVIVVNNDVSESRSLQELRQTVRFALIESGENSGFGHGNNLGAKQARGTLIGFINPDTLWTGACLRGVARTFDEEQSIGVLGLTLLDTGRKPEPWSAGDAPTLLNLVRDNVIPSRPVLPKTGNLSFFDWVSGGALFIRAALFSDVGGFDERFFMYFEDVDLCMEVRKRRFLVARHAAFSLIHLGGRSSSSARFQKKQFYASQKKYFEKHRPMLENRILGLLQSFFLVSR